jgi:hypothetical protein
MATLSNLTTLSILAPASVTASNTGTTGVDLIKYVLKRQIKVILGIAGVSGTNPTMDVKLQESSDNSNWTDVTSGAFAQQTAAGHNEIHVKLLPTTRYVRMVSVIGGTSTPTFVMYVDILVENRLT